jgi:ribonuclease HI
MGKKEKFYAIKIGRRPGIYREWYGEGGAEAQIKGFPNAIHKSFPTREDAESFLKSTIKKRPRRKAVKKQPSDADFDENGIIIYTDGSCISNPGPGGYGVVILYGKSRKELSGGYRLTTNNRMELMACIVGLQTLEPPSSVILHSDSQYVVNGISKGWAKKWKANNWMRNKKESAQNPDLWEQLLELCEKHDVNFVWVKGHAGNQENEICDQMANKAASQKKLLKDKGYVDARN